ncbi:MAG: tetratricopeptide repeat protein [Bryobacteraceae bacterium]
MSAPFTPGSGPNSEVLINLHPQSLVERLARLLSSTASHRLFELIGPRSSGRTYLLESAAAEARRRGAAITIVPIDLDGCEPDTSLAAYLAFAAAKAEASGSADASETASYLRKFAEGLSGEPASCDRVAAIAAALALQLPPMPLEDVLAASGANGDVVFHVADGVMLDRVSRRLLLDAIAPHPSVRLAIGHETPPPADGDSERIFISRWDEEEMRERVRERISPCALPRDFLEAIWQAPGGASRLAVASRLHNLQTHDAIRKDAFGAWSVQRDWRKDRTVVEELSRDPALFIDEALEDLDPSLETTTLDFLRAAALCHPVIPVNILLAFAGLDAAGHSDFIEECIDEPLGAEDDESVFEDLGYNHPSFPRGLFPSGQLVYRFRDPRMPEAILDRLAPPAREALAQRLLTFLDRSIPPVTKGIARMRLELIARLGLTRERERLDHILSWWAAAESTALLRDELVAGMREGHFSPDFVLTVYRETANLWPPSRRVALLEAHRNQPGGPSAGPAADAELCSLLFQCKRYDDVIKASTQALQGGVGDTDRGGLLTLQGWSYRERGLLPEAEAALRAAVEVGNQSQDASLTQPHESLAYLLLEQERYAEAQALVENIVSVMRTSLGQEDPRTLVWQCNLARLWMLAGRGEDARQLFENTIEHGVRVFGEDSPIVRMAAEGLEELRAGDA